MNRRYLPSISIAMMAFGATAGASTIIAPTDDPNVTAQMYRDAALPYTSVGQVQGSGFNGSGVLIGENCVLTAGHVALSKAGGSFILGGVTYTIQSSIVHPNFSLTGPSFDVGILFLSSDVSNAAPAQMYDFGDSSTSILGREATWVGRGFTGDGLTGAQPSFEFRAFTNVIDVLGDHPLYEGLPATSFISDFDRPGDPSKNNPASSATPTALEGNVANGDSGGGVFVKVGGIDYLVGVSSYSGRLDIMPGSSSGRYGALSGAAHLDLFYPWIFDQTGIEAVPEPGSALLAGLGALTLLSRRRRKIDE